MIQNQLRNVQSHKIANLKQIYLKQSRAMCLETGKQYHQSHQSVSLFVTCILIRIQTLQTLKSQGFLDHGLSFQIDINVAALFLV